MALKLYVSHNRPNLRVALDNGELVQFRGGSVQLDDENERDQEIIAELDAALASGSSLSASVSLVDVAEAERVAREHLEQQKQEEAMQQSLRGVTRHETLRDTLLAGEEPLPAELREASGSGSGTDGMRLSELQELLNKGKQAGAESPSGV